MTKTDMIQKIAEKTGMRSSEAAQTLDVFLTAIATSLKAGEDVKLAGFGNLKTEQRAARQGRNPRTGEPVSIPASKTVKFTPAKALKDAIQD